jgi:uncharacterized protein YjbI with pentapeptide repeats
MKWSISGWLVGLLSDINERKIVTALCALILVGFAVSWSLSFVVVDTNTQIGRAVTWLSNASANLMSEMCGALITFVIIDVALRRKQEAASSREADIKQQVRLTGQLKSISRDIALGALEELRHRGWLFDGTLNFMPLEGAQLDGAKMPHAQLRSSALRHASLKETEFIYAKLQQADLEGANLEDAMLLGANLEQANLSRANLSGAFLWLANLRGAQMAGAILSEVTTLPDNTFWSSDTDLGRFTNPNHPDFWRSEDRNSPAYLPPDAEDNETN